jgi:hypothetical protein
MAFCVQCGAASSGGSFCTECGTAVGGTTAAKVSKPKKLEPTEFAIRCEILHDLWMNRRGDEMFDDFIAYNDLGLPLAYAVDTDIVDVNDRVAGYIDETFEQLLGSLGIEDEGFSDLDEMIR